MQSKLTPPAPVRRWSLLTITALVVAYVRNFIQYRQYYWESTTQFLISWFLYYFAIAILIGISYAFISTKAAYFLEGEKESRKISFEEAMVYVSLILLTAALLMFFVAHWPPSAYDSE